MSFLRQSEISFVLLFPLVSTRWSWWLFQAFTCFTNYNWRLNFDSKFKCLENSSWCASKCTVVIMAFKFLPQTEKIWLIILVNIEERVWNHWDLLSFKMNTTRMKNKMCWALYRKIINDERETDKKKAYKFDDRIILLL